MWHARLPGGFWGAPAHGQNGAAYMPATCVALQKATKFADGARASLLCKAREEGEFLEGKGFGEGKIK